MRDQFSGRFASGTAVSLAERFWAKVDKSGDCWLWTGATQRGYGEITVTTGGPPAKAHRLAWQWATGETLSPTEHILHTCDVPGCVRNDDAGTYVVAGIAYPRVGHLFRGTAAVNNDDKDAKGRGYKPPIGVSRNAGESHGMAKLTAEQVIRIRMLSDQGWTLARLGPEFGVSPTAIWKVVHRRHWQSIP